MNGDAAAVSYLNNGLKTTELSDAAMRWIDGYRMIPGVKAYGEGANLAFHAGGEEGYRYISFALVCWPYLGFMLSQGDKKMSLLRGDLQLRAAQQWTAFSHLFRLTFEEGSPDRVLIRPISKNNKPPK